MAENYTYIVKCRDGTLYTGWTNDLTNRLLAHNAGTGAKYTRSRRPVVLVYQEQFATKEEAMRRGVGDQTADPGAKAPLDRRAPNKRKHRAEPHKRLCAVFLFWEWSHTWARSGSSGKQRLGGFHAGTNGMELKLEGGFPQELVFLHHTQQIHGARAAQVQVSGGEVKPHCVRDLAEEFQMLVPPSP